MSANAVVDLSRFENLYRWFPSLELGLDLSRTNFTWELSPDLQQRTERALREMRELEAGAIANKDENRMVGHYWLRNPAIAPTAEIRGSIEDCLNQLEAFAAEVHSGKVCGSGGSFKHLLVVGIGGSALGPQFVANALSHPQRDRMRLHFVDNTDPDGMARVLAGLGSDLGRTLCIVISKSGGTKETRNGMLEVGEAYKGAGLSFASHVVAVTSAGSDLDKYAVAQGWLRRFPMWDWVGGRTSELSAVGLLPAVLQGFNIRQLLEGAKECDNVTRSTSIANNPALTMALLWYQVGNGLGSKSMVVLPYKDRLELLSKYLQQLVMESLGKELDRSGRRVEQGLTVFGNKGSTDQHAYVQQLRDGLANFFCVFIQVLKDQEGRSLEVEADTTSGDYLMGFLLGTRDALAERQRQSALITISAVNEFSIGALIALFERAVGYYASLIDINAYHQPGVEAGKKAAGEILALQKKVLGSLMGTKGQKRALPEIVGELGNPALGDLIFRICEHLAANGRIQGSQIHEPAAAKFWV